MSVAQPRLVRALLAKTTQLKIALKAPAASSHFASACLRRAGAGGGEQQEEEGALTREVFGISLIFYYFFSPTAALLLGTARLLFLEFIKSAGCCPWNMLL